MWSSWVIPVLFMFGSTEISHTHPSLSCVNDYMKSMTCEWRPSSAHAGHHCKLKVIRSTPRGEVEKECKLETLSYDSNATRACNITYDSLIFNFAETVVLQVVCDDKHVVPPVNYHPGRHVQLRQLRQPSIAGNNITWNRGDLFPESIKNYEFELQLKHTGQSWEEATSSRVYTTFALLSQDILVAGKRYEARVRVKPDEPSTEGHIQGQWSEWSSALSWSLETSKNGTPEAFSFETGLLVVVIGTVLIPLIICISYTSKRSALKTGGQHVPDPSKYFQPLLSIHGGNFQKWLGPHHCAHTCLSPQACNCDISPVEISEAPVDALSLKTATLFQTNQMALYQQTSSTGQSLSSNFSNMGYFYSELQSGSMCLESCPVYFTYQPEGGSSGTVQSAPSYECLHNQSQQLGEPLSPDSGFDIGEMEDKEENEKGGGEMCRGVNVQHLVSFVLSLAEGSRVPSTAVHIPTSFSPLPELSAWPEDAEVPVASKPSEQTEGAVVRPASMVVQPCTSGYLSLKEMQEYNNKSI